MKYLLFIFILLLTHPIFGFHASMGFTWNTIDESFHSNLFTNANARAKDQFNTHSNRLAPVVKLGHQIFFHPNWLLGLSLEWKYLNYKTPNVNSSVGQILPNATFSSRNIFGGETDRDFTSITRLYNEVLLCFYFGKKIFNGYTYLGLGPVFFNASNKIYVSSVHVPNGIGNTLISTHVKSNRIIWGGAVQFGYQYFLCPRFFLNFNYTYLQTQKQHFSNSVNTAILNGFITPGPTTLFLNREIEFAVQDVTFSINLAY